MAACGNENASDEVFNFKCTPCAKVKKNTEAVNYCVECQGYCCQSCADMHNVFPTLANHHLLDKSQFQTRGLPTDLTAVPTELCSIHNLKVADMFCGNHEVVGCTTCMALDHRNCSDVQSIPDTVDTIFQTSDVFKTDKRLQDKQAELEKISKTRDQLIQELKRSKKEALETITNFRREMEILLDKLENVSVNEVEKEFRRMEYMLEKERKEADHEVASMKQVGDDLKKSEGNKAQQFVCMKTAQKKIAQAEDISQSLDIRSDGKITYVIETKIRDLLQELETFGQINRHSTAILKPMTAVYSIRSSKVMNIKLSNDEKPSCVSDSCFTEDNMLLLTDYSNKKLKRIDMVKMSVVDQCDLPGEPCSVCCTSKQEAAVCLYSNSTILFLSLGKMMTPTRTIELDYRCYGIAYKDDKLYVTDAGRSVYIHDMTGRLLQTITQDSSGHALFADTRYIAVNDDGDKVFVADNRKGLITLDGLGKHINTFIDSELTYAHGVCTDRRGNVFVCGYTSHNIVQIGQDGKKLGVVVKQSDGVHHPYSICFHPQQSTLIVTQWYNDTVFFDLQ